MKPLSALYYIRENRGRAAIVIFMFLLTTFLVMAGNFIDSVYYYFDKFIEYSDVICDVNAVASDEDFKEFASFLEDMKQDENLIILPRTPKPYGGLDWVCTLGFEMGSASFVFNTPQDLQTAFDRLGVTCDCSSLKEGSVVISKALAKQYDLKVGDVLTSDLCENIKGTYTVDALIDDDSYIVFYVINDPSSEVRINVMGKNMQGQELRDYLMNLKGDRKADIATSEKENIDSIFGMFFPIFYAGITLLSIVLAVTVNSILTGHYIKRSYEFGVYRAIGISRKEIFAKCAKEILTMDLFAILIGVVVMLLLTFLLNELLYIPVGQYLPYYSKVGIIGFVVSNLLVVIPMICLKGRSMGRVDITEF